MLESGTCDQGQFSIGSRIIPNYPGQAEEAELAMVDYLARDLSLAGRSRKGMRRKKIHRKERGVDTHRR